MTSAGPSARPFVNLSSRFASDRFTDRARGLARVAVLTLGLWSLLHPSAVRADPVLVLGATGPADVDEDSQIDLTLSVRRAVASLGHRVVDERGAFHASAAEVPETANELRAIAEIHGASYVVVPILRTSGPEAYWVSFRVGYTVETRVEELEAEVRRSSEAARLEALLGALLRPGGVGVDGAALSGADQAGRDAEAAQAQAAAEAAAAEAAAEEAAAQEAAAQEPSDNHEPEAEPDAEPPPIYAEGRPWGVSAGLGLHGLVRAGAGGGALGAFELRGQRAIGPAGLELRAGLDFFYGAAGAMAMSVGASYVRNPIASFRRLYVGGGVAIGWFQAFSGNRVASFLARAHGLAILELNDLLNLEVEVPSITVLSANGGVVALGFSVRLGARF